MIKKETNSPVCPRPLSSPPEEGSGLFLGGHCGEGGPMPTLPSPRATSSADCHPCQGALCPGGSQGHICAAMCRAAHKTALAWDQQHPLPGGKAASDPNFGKHTGVMGTSCLLHLPWGSWDQLPPSSFKMKVMELPSGFGGS